MLKDQLVSFVNYNKDMRTVNTFNHYKTKAKHKLNMQQHILQAI